MSGHSKWSTIKRKKEKTDGQKAKIFTKIGKEIMVSVKESGSNPDANSKLKDLIAKAKQNNVPNDNIERIIKKAETSTTKESYEAVLYEGYGPSGVAVLVEGLTDNRNRTAGDVRHYFDKFGGNLGAIGCVSFMFSKQGVIILKNEDIDQDLILEYSIELGASDVEFLDDAISITSSPEDFTVVRDGLEKLGYIFIFAQIEQVPDTYVTLTDEDSILKMEKLIEHLEDNDDILQIWHNFSIE